MIISVSSASMKMNNENMAKIFHENGENGVVVTKKEKRKRNEIEA
jgi:hypothetical protein